MTVTAVIDFAADAALAAPPSRLCFRDPVRVIEAGEVDDVWTALRVVRQAAADGFWVVGYVAYDAAPAFDSALVVRHGSSDLPLLWFGVFTAPDAPSPECPAPDIPDSWGGTWVSDLTEAEYTARVATISEAIRAGETYQVNFTRRLTLPADASARNRRQDAFPAYERLRKAQDGAYSAYLDTGRFQILSASPELFFQTRGREIMVRPMKGTAPRGRWCDEDDANRERLAASKKERAENVMIVDLLRSDLGRVAQTGTVRVTELFAVEMFPTVLQLTSTIGATLRPDAALEDVFRALFPCGSVTGAPKAKTTEHIAAGETGPRGVYCGAIGLVRPGGDSVFSVAIRTVVLDGATGAAEYGVGGGITEGSVACEEWEETQIKAGILQALASAPQPDFDLLETLRLDGGIYHLLDRHLTRACSSSAYFGRPFDEARIRAELAIHAAQRPTGAWRARLLLSANGTPRVEVFALGERPSSPLAVRMAATPVRQSDPFICHKTTNRVVYDFHRAAAGLSVYDVLLWNENGEITEFTTGNVALEYPNGDRVTPPRTAGLLDGTLRADLIERGELRVATLRREDILNPDNKVFFLNSVRGMLRATVVA